MTNKFFIRLVYGFTLAEVLLTMTIIGVVVALVIPGFIDNYNKRIYASRVKKAYAVLSQATREIMIDNGGIIPDNFSSIKNMYDAYKLKLSIAKDCGSSGGCGPDYESTINGGSFPPSPLYFQTIYARAFASGCYSFITNDGIAVTFRRTASNGIIIIDINGLKDPNRWGRDVFEFTLTDNGLISTNYYGCDSSTYGISCAGQILQDGEMNY